MMFEIEKKFLITNSNFEKLKPYLKESKREDMAQWYINGERTRLKVNGIGKKIWIKELKKNINGEQRIEKKLSPPTEEEKKSLYLHPVVIKQRYYFDDDKKISLDIYIFPDFGKILEIELNKKENEEYLRLLKENKETDKIFERKLKNLPLNWKELKKHEKTKDERYFNFNIAKILYSIPESLNQCRNVFHEEILKLYDFTDKKHQ